MKLLLLAALVLSCTQPKSARCRAVCAKEADCIEAIKRDTETGFDEKSCVATCSSLEAEEASIHLVEAHEACIKKAGENCTAVLACHR